MSSEIIKDFLKIAPNSAGVYKMLNSSCDVLYVGKARNLKNRLSSYAHGKDHSPRIINMIAQIAKVEIICTNNELEALLLESNLIKKYRPKYNILLKDDKSFPYLLLKEEHEFTQITKYRGLKNIKGSYFGPFISPQKLDETIAYIQKMFLLRSCSDYYFKTRKRPCLLYQVKRCSAPCVGKITVADYQHLVRQAKNFLSGKNQALKSELKQKMQQASQMEDFEQAAIYRDRLKLLEIINAKQNIDLEGSQNLDVVALNQAATQLTIILASFRNGQNLGSKNYAIELESEISEHDAQEALANFMLNYYQHHQVPELILTNIKLEDQVILEKALLQLTNQKTKIEQPTRGKKLALVKFAIMSKR